MKLFLPFSAYVGDLETSCFVFIFSRMGFKMISNHNTFTEVIYQLLRMHCILLYHNDAKHT